MALSQTWFQEWSPPLDVFQSDAFRLPHATSNLHYSTRHYHDAQPSNAIGFQPVEFIGEQIDYLHQTPQYFPPTHLNPFFSRDRGNNGSNALRLLPPLAWLSLHALAQTPSLQPSTVQQADPLPPRSSSKPLRSQLKSIFEWKVIDFEYDSPEERSLAISSGAFVPPNTLPLGLETYQGRLFVTFPRWKNGVPATLATLPLTQASFNKSPPLKPYPDWTFHQPKGDCSSLTSVFRIAADKCGNLWVLDSGQVESLTKPQQLCPPQLFQFDLNTDKLVARHIIPSEYVLQNSLFSNVVVDSRTGDCSDLFVYIADVWRFGLLVFNPREKKFWRFSNHLFFPDPLASDYTVHGLNFQWTDGIFGMALSPIENDGDRTLFFHPMSGYREFTVKTSILRDENKVANTAGAFVLIGESRGLRGQSSASAADNQGVLFFNLVSLDALGCWDMRKPYKRDTLGVAARNNVTMIFPNDLKIDNSPEQNVWLLTNRLPFFLYKGLDNNDINFRIFNGSARGIVRGTICDPKVSYTGDTNSLEVR